MIPQEKRAGDEPLGRNVAQTCIVHKHKATFRFSGSVPITLRITNVHGRTSPVGAQQTYGLTETIRFRRAVLFMNVPSAPRTQRLVPRNPFALTGTKKDPQCAALGGGWSPVCW